MNRDVYIGLGANLGKGLDALRSAVTSLEETGLVEVQRASSIYKTTPIGDIEQDDFFNAVIGVDTQLSPRGLLALMLETEQQFGRERTIRWGPRILDLDLLFFGDVIEDMPGLLVPHPEILNRGFVLVPMVEIAPDFVHPVLKQTTRELCEAWISRTPSADLLVRSLDGADGILFS